MQIKALKYINNLPGFAGHSAKNFWLFELCTIFSKLKLTAAMFAPPLINENELLLNIYAGDQNSFNILYNHYHHSVSAFALNFVKSPTLAKDLSQEIFLKIWEKRGTLKEVQSFRAYLFIIARNQTLNSLKKSARQGKFMAEIVHHYTSLRSPVEDKILSQEYLQFIDSILDTFSPRTREVFKLCREEEKSYDEAAIQLQISRNAVKNHMVQANKILKSALKKNLGIITSLFISFISIH